MTLQAKSRMKLQSKGHQGESEDSSGEEYDDPDDGDYVD